MVHFCAGVDDQNWSLVTVNRQSMKTLFRRVFEVTASLGLPTINRGSGLPFWGAEHLGDLVSLCESAWELSNSLVTGAIIAK